MSNYKWLLQRFETQLSNELRDKVDWGEMTEDEADLEFNRRVEEFEAGYGDYMYDTRGDR